MNISKLNVEGSSGCSLIAVLGFQPRQLLGITRKFSEKLFSSHQDIPHCKLTVGRMWHWRKMVLELLKKLNEFD